jgi:hypothetical protein
MTFDPSMTQRLVSRAKRRIVPDWRARWDDLSTRIAKWGALLQGALLMVPAEHAAKLPQHLSAYLALAMFVLVGAAKLITEPGRVAKEPT